MTDAGFLATPVELSRSRRRLHLVLLGVVMLLGLAHGAYWSVTTIVFDPVDEIAHFGYVQSVAEGHGVPVIGRDRISDEVLGTAKAAPTDGYGPRDLQPVNTDPNWGGAGEQYEATAAPTYYALMAPAYWLGRSGGVPRELLAVRLATVLVGLAAVPLTWALARRAFPRRPAVWLAAPLLLVAANSFAYGAVTNDPLAVVLTLATTVALLRTLDRPSGGRAVAMGVLLGLALLTKATILVVAPLWAMVFVAWLVVARPGARRAAGLLATIGVTVAVVCLPWVAWNLSTYHALSGVREVSRLLVPANTGFSRHRLGQDVGNAHLGLWSNQMTRGTTYPLSWTVLLAVSAVAGGLVAWLRRQWDDLAGLLWSASALPLSFVAAQVINYTLEHGLGAPLGRHLLPAVPFAAIAIAGGAAVVVGERWVPVVAGLVITGAFLLEGQMVADYVNRSYLQTTLPGNLTAVVRQNQATGIASLGSVRVEPACPMVGFTIGLVGPAPATLEVQTPTGPQLATAELVSSSIPIFAEPRPDTAFYRLPSPAVGAHQIELPAGSNVTISPAGPVLSIYCQRAMSTDAVFSRAYNPHHPVRITQRQVETLPLLAALATLLATARYVVTRPHQRQICSPRRSRPARS